MFTIALLETALMVVPVATLLILGTVLAVTSEVAGEILPNSNTSRLRTIASVAIHLAGVLGAILLLQILIGFRLHI